MPDRLLPYLLIVAVVIAWVVAKVIGYARKSERQWQEVDRSKLKKWEDDDDWQ